MYIAAHPWKKRHNWHIDSQYLRSLCLASIDRFVSFVVIESDTAQNSCDKNYYVNYQWSKFGWNLSSNLNSILTKLLCPFVTEQPLLCVTLLRDTSWSLAVYILYTLPGISEIRCKWQNTYLNSFCASFQTPLNLIYFKGSIDGCCSHLLWTAN